MPFGAGKGENDTMSTPSPAAPAPARNRGRIFTRPRIISLIVVAALLCLCLAFSWITRDAMSKLPSSAGNKQTRGSAASSRTIVDLSPWQNAEALAQLATTAEEKEYARQAERLADHAVDQAFAAALREAAIRTQNRALTGDALRLSQRVDQLKQIVAQDEASVRQLSGGPAATKGNAPPDDTDDTDLSIAKAQLQLDSDELDDAQEDLQRATGDERPQIQSELSAHEAAMKKYDSQTGEEGQFAVLSASRYGTLAGRVAAWNRQSARLQMIQQAGQQAESDVKSLTLSHKRLETSSATPAAQDGNAAQDRTSRLARLQDRSTARQLMSIYDDRIQTEQQSASVYDKWAAQVQLQHRIVLHLILDSLAWVFAILVCMILGAAMVRRLMLYPVLDPRERHTLRSILELCIQIIGAGCILLVIFGPPKETATMLGLATAALTIALQDFILAFLGWFVLIGRRGMRVGDTVEIDGVGGEVIEIGVLATTLLETGAITDRGYPTGRRISLMNGFAIRGKYFNFSTAGQWMWGQFDVAVPSSVEVHVVVDKILKAVEEETADDMRQADQEWSRSVRGHGLTRLRSLPAVNLRPTGNNFEVEVHYVTRASQRFETRNRLYGRVIELLRTHSAGGDQAAAIMDRPAE
jgi:small-conductance mechanosensitive channel